MNRFVLFDVDGTLIRPGARVQRVHMSAMADAITAVAGISESFRYVGGQLFYGDLDCAGFTDAGTVYAALAGHGVPSGDIDLLTDLIVDEMQRRVLALDHDQPDGDCLLPGARTLVSGLVGTGVGVGLSTGNATEVARWKMRRVGMADLLHDGGFGQRSRRREQVVRTAVEGLSRGELASGLLIGDTVADVRAARAAGIAVVAVATGPAPVEVLRDAGADAVATSLSDPWLPEVIAGLLDAPRKLTGSVWACGDEAPLRTR